MSILEFLASVNGVAYLVAQDGQLLGLLSSDQCNPDSISNPCGIYGSPCGVYSIRNPCGIYGGSCGIYSPYNTVCINPPVIVYQGQVVMLVTKNNYVMTNGLPVVDPDLLLGIYAQLGGQGLSTVQQMNYMYSTMGDRVNQGAQNTMNAVQNAASIIASMFY
ncbi:MAG: hypothetical protein AB3A66_28000 (plasmid) [Nodularia sp. CChRGM 3473]